MNTGLHYFLSTLKSAHSKADVLQRFGNLSDNICEHLSKILTIKDAKAQEHWIKEVNAWMDTLARVESKCRCNIRTEQKVKKLNQYDDGAYVWQDVLEYCKGNSNHQALVYKSWRAACSMIPEILSQFCANTQAFLLSSGLESLTAFKSAIKARGDETYVVTLKELQSNKKL